MAVASRRVVKLVRTGIARRLLREGGLLTHTYYRLTGQDHVEYLRKKLVEEALEYLLNPSVEELADLYQAVRDVALVDLRVPWLDIEEAAREKAEERGDFRDGWALVVEAEKEVAGA